MVRPVSSAEMSLVASYVHTVSGVVIESGKEYLVRGRLGPLLEREGVSGFGELVRQARLDGSGRLEKRIIDAITTNETSFFRDERPFHLLAHKLLPDHFERTRNTGPRGKPRLDIWCAAASTGQEVYSVAMVVKELLFDLSGYWIRILGTDISEEALAMASRGYYTAREVSRGLSDRRLARHLRRVGDRWQVSDELRSLVTFSPLNLLGRFRHVGTFDVILCRNVAIYFSLTNRCELFERLADRLRPDGALIVGSTESIIGLTKRFVRQTHRDAVYYRGNHERRR